MLISLYLLSHLIGDFPLQSDLMVALKAKRPWYASSLVPHAAVHFLLAVLFTLPYLVVANQGWRILGVSVVSAVLHLVIDFGKVRIDGQVQDCGGFSAWVNNAVLRLVPALHPGESATKQEVQAASVSARKREVRTAPPSKHEVRFTRLGLFVLDQLAHVAAIVFAVWLFEPSLLARTMQYPSAVIAGQHPFLSPAQSMLAIVIVLLYATTVSGVIVQTLTSPAPSAEATSAQGQEPEVPRGKLIGYLERIFVVCALCMGAYTMIPLVVGAKSLVRFKKFDSPGWAEYFLVGTLGSILCGTLSGLALRFLLHL
ncbi:DUF3307 domain-containing protein [Alicyclobacillus sp. ALC3]|uniref:DUF3307 domain-containing protein n=1 Tax=Alicyclobacillus sp. ALC3 TaxID=2796143 RepID=UPI0023788D2B|nr:DUF3307 domain-containing protein [Alicyclobacillus sp. ALC3]WDL95334.1 DUF3307 domain-containing protein [Alicyclobacillus sp. ALC3]